jgi:hypothetical protein
MNDMSSVIVPKSDQINAEDFIAGPRTFTIEGVAISPGTEQPVSIKLAGEPRVFRPCKSMSRVLVGGWGPDASVYVGRSVTLYRDPKVKWGGLEVGGIRISHMSHIERDMVMSLTATKGKRAPHQVRVLKDAPRQQQNPDQDEVVDYVSKLIARIQAAPDRDAVGDILAEPIVAKRRPWLAKERPLLSADLEAAITGFVDNPFAEGRADDQHGEVTTLESAMAEIDSAETVTDVNARVAALVPLLPDEDADALRSHAMDRVSALSGA